MSTAIGSAPNPFCAAFAITNTFIYKKGWGKWSNLDVRRYDI